MSDRVPVWLVMMKNNVLYIILCDFIYNHTMSYNLPQGSVVRLKFYTMLALHSFQHICFRIDFTP